MKKDGNYIKEALAESTNYSELEIYKIMEVLDTHFIIGRNNKDKIVADFAEKLSISMEEADELYNTCASIIVKGIFK